MTDWFMFKLICTTALASYAESGGVHIFLFQEPYILNGSFAGLPPGWLCFSCTSSTSMILCTESAFTIVKGLSSSNSVFITITLVQGPLIIGSVYSPPSGDLEEDMSFWITYYLHSTRMVIGGDLNVPLRMLVYARENDWTEIFADYLMIANLRLVNTVDAPHSYAQDSRLGRPDLSLLGVDILPYLQEWSVDENVFSFSDHRCIMCPLCMQQVLRTYDRFKTKNKSMRKFNKHDLFQMKIKLFA